jgi:transposase, IS30 family
MNCVVLGVKSNQTMPHYAQLTLAQRYQIQALTQQPIRQLDIAKQLGVSPATISRELARNRQTGTYQAIQAQERTARLRHRSAYKLTGSLKEDVINRLVERHSPEQISGALARQKAGKVISHEAIYQFIYKHEFVDGQELKSFLRIRHKKRYKKRGQPEQRGSIPNRVGIEERPPIVETNTEVGHWEGDTVIGANHDGVLLTLVERVTKYTLIVKLPSKHAQYLATKLIACLLRCFLPVRSITFDNGREFTDHQRISRGLNATVYFARPYHSWERGLNENTNGLIRQYIPKHCGISMVKPSDVSWIQDQLNHRPRKTLGFLTPIQYAQKQGIALQT